MSVYHEVKKMRDSLPQADPYLKIRAGLPKPGSSSLFWNVVDTSDEDNERVIFTFAKRSQVDAFIKGAAWMKAVLDGEDEEY